MAIEVGREAPDFTLTSHRGDEVTLSSFRGERHVLLSFFPSAFSVVCTPHFTRVAEKEARFADEDAQIIGISVDNQNALRAFAEQLGLEDTLFLADFEPKGEVARSYGVYIERAGLAGRATFLIDKAGVVRHVELTDNPGIDIDEDRYFAALDACRVSAE